MVIVIVWIVIISILVIFILLFSDGLKIKRPLEKNGVEEETPIFLVNKLIEQNKGIQRHIDNVENLLKHLSLRGNQDSAEVQHVKGQYQQILKSVDNLTKSVDGLNLKIENFVASQSSTTRYQQEATFKERQRFASQLDSKNPDGFTDSLLSNSYGAHIYEITIHSPSTASYRITSNDAVLQELLLTIRSGILSDGCEFSNTPTGSNDKIMTLENGELEKQGDIWIIKKKTIIKFV